MKRLILVFLITLVSQYASSADITKLRPEDRRVLQGESRFHEIHSTTNLPPQIISLCADGNGRIAEPGKKWEATDVITDDKLPRKRLIWAASDGDYYVVHYESGGIAHSFHVLVAKFKEGNSKAEFVWHAVGKRLKDYKALLTAVEYNSLSDEFEYAR